MPERQFPLWFTSPDLYRVAIHTPIASIIYSSRSNLPPHIFGCFRRSCSLPGIWTFILWTFVRSGIPCHIPYSRSWGLLIRHFLELKLSGLIYGCLVMLYLCNRSVFFFPLFFASYSINCALWAVEIGTKYADSANSSESLLAPFSSDNGPLGDHSLRTTPSAAGP